MMIRWVKSKSSDLVSYVAMFMPLFSMLLLIVRTNVEFSLDVITHKVISLGCFSRGDHSPFDVALLCTFSEVL